MLLLGALAILLSFPQTDGKTEPKDIAVVDAIDCRLDVPAYTAFAMAIDGEEQLARRRHWTRIASANAFMHEYELPQPILVAGAYHTRRIAFTGNAILAILDLPDPAVIGRVERIDNTMSAEPMIAALIATGKVSRAQAEAEIKFRKFLGERIVREETLPAGEGESFGIHKVVARSISNATTHPGKTFYGCSYRFDLLGTDGTPL